MIYSLKFISCLKLQWKEKWIKHFIHSTASYFLSKHYRWIQPFTGNIPLKKGFMINRLFKQNLRTCMCVSWLLLTHLNWIRNKSFRLWTVFDINVVLDLFTALPTCAHVLLLRLITLYRNSSKLVLRFCRECATDRLSYFRIYHISKMYIFT